MDVVRRSVKYPRIEIKSEGTIRIIAPPGFDVDDFIRKKQNWIEDKLGRISSVASQVKGKENMLLLNGSFYEVRNGRFPEVDAVKRVVTTPNLPKLRQWLREKLREEMDYKSKLLSRLMGVKYGRIYIRRQKTKWASCSGKGNLSFNVSIMALPEILREYIVVHELSHQLERNHTRKFWRIVERQYPDYRKAKEELKRYSLILARNEVWKKLAEERTDADEDMEPSSENT